MGSKPDELAELRKMCKMTLHFKQKSINEKMTDFLTSSGEQVTFR